MARRHQPAATARSVRVDSLQMSKRCSGDAESGHFREKERRPLRAGGQRPAREMGLRDIARKSVAHGATSVLLKPNSELSNNHAKIDLALRTPDRGDYSARLKRRRDRRGARSDAAPSRMSAARHEDAIPSVDACNDDRRTIKIGPTVASYLRAPSRPAFEYPAYG